MRVRRGGMPNTPHFRYEFPMHVGQAVTTPLLRVSQLLVIEVELIENRRLEIVTADGRGACRPSPTRRSTCSRRN
jgi:hypothetical protein